MRIRHLCLLFLLMLSSSTHNKSDELEDNALIIQNTVEYNFKNKHDLESIIHALEGFLNTKNDSYLSNEFWIENDNSFYKYPFFEISNLENFGGMILKPSLLSVTQINSEHFICKLGWFYNNEKSRSLQYIYNVSVVKKNETFLLKNILEYNIKDWEKKEIKRVTYWTDNSHKINIEKADEFNDINNKLSTFFQSDVISFNYVLCNSNNELMRLIGYDFESSMFFSNQNGSIAFPDDRLIFSGNNNEINTHELVHLYLTEKFKNLNPYMNEGVASLFGGSKGLEYKDHLHKLKTHLISNEIDIYQEYFFGNYVIDFDTSLRYTLSAFICELTLKKFGKDKLFELINCGKSNYDIINYIKKYFEVNPNDFNDFIKYELENYDFEKRPKKLFY
ncbi:hypothetical protein ES731_14220 [Psychroflexus gondwanensis]|uniref:hypothetical protein n=1 Tax=Psychroflexus gondwanensis TaxID=251 RepID=UPI0011BED02C|nr:hypothetical protein [Psychroflexus gondwanensis]TXE16359.1 hypothetical protein ES731_14220 [Psychroflexus gondwanensis]